MLPAWRASAHADVTALLTADAVSLGVAPRVIAEQRGNLSFLGHLAGVPRPFLADATAVGGTALTFWRVHCTVPLSRRDERRLLREASTLAIAREVGRLLRWWVAEHRPGAVLAALPPAEPGPGTMSVDLERGLEQDLVRHAAQQVAQRLAQRLATSDPALAADRFAARGQSVLDADSLSDALTALTALLRHGAPLEGEVTVAIADVLAVTPTWLLTGQDAPGTHP